MRGIDPYPNDRSLKIMGPRLRIVVATIGVAAVILGSIGVFQQLDTEIPFADRLLESIYLSLHLFTISYPDFLAHGASEGDASYSISWQLQVARFLAPLVTVTAAISLFSIVLEKWIKRAKVLLFYREHAVVYGFNLRSRFMCEDLLENRIRVIVMDPDLDREEMDWLRRKGIVAFEVSGTNSIAPRLCKAEKARYLFAAYEDDALNLKILVRAYQRNRESYEALRDGNRKTDSNRFSTHFYAHFTEVAFKRLKFGGQFSNLDDYFTLQIFSVYDQSAKKLAQSIYHKYTQPALSGERIHILLFGLGESGRAMLEQLIRLSYFSDGAAAQITVIDEDSVSWECFLEVFPALGARSGFYSESDAERVTALIRETNFPNVTFRAIPFDSASLASGSAFTADSEENEIRIGIASLNEATRNLALADCLLEQKRCPMAEVFIRSDDPNSEIRKYIRSEMNRKRLSSFPPQDETCRLRSLNEDGVELLAQAIHEEYLGEIGEEGQNQSSNTPWSALDESFKESNRRAALHVAIKCKLLGLPDFDLETADGLASIARELRSTLNRPEELGKRETLSICEHNRWCAEKLLDGWVPGKTRNDALKRHPNLIPWNLNEDLASGVFEGYVPLSERDKDKDRHTVVKIPDYLEAIAK